MAHASYHTHTRWSDGKGTVADMIAAAATLGLEALGLSDHYVVHPEGKTYPWSIAMDELDGYVEEVRTLAADAAITVRLGLEVDWFPGYEAVLPQRLAAHGFDYLIGSVHEVGDTILDGSPQVWERMSAATVDQVHCDYWRAIGEMAASGLFDIAAHLDLPKKFGFRPTTPPAAEIESALDALAAAGCVVELNTAGWHKPCADAYPSREILRGCRARDIPVTLSSDAHQPDHLIRDFDRGAARLKEAGYHEIARFEGTARTMVPLGC